MSKSKQTPVHELSCEEFDEIHHPRPMETDFGRLVEKEISRRGFLGAGIAFGASAFVAGAGVLRPSTARAAGDRFGFEAIPTNTLDTVTVAPGYNWHVVAKWGEPMWSNASRVRPHDAGHGGKPGALRRRQQRRHVAVQRRGRPERARVQQRVHEPQDLVRRIR